MVRAPTQVIFISRNNRFRLIRFYYFDDNNVYSDLRYYLDYYSDYPDYSVNLVSFFDFLDTINKEFFIDV